METTGKTYEYDEALRARTEAYTDKDTGAISRNLLGKRIGVSGASVSTYVNRKMACSPENIEAKLREYFRQEDEREQAAARKEDFQLDTGYKPTSVSEDAYQTIQHAQQERKLVILHGDPGVGKTQAALQYCRDNPKSTVYIRIQAHKTSMAGVASMLCDRLGLPQTGGSEKMWDAIHARLMNTNMLIIVDEAQLLKQNVLDELRQFPDGDELEGIPGNGVALIGNSELYERIRRIEIRKQTRSRMAVQRAYRTRDLTKEDVQMLFPQFTGPEQKKELKLLADICRASSSDIRMAKNIVDLAAGAGDLSYEGLLRAAASTPVGII